MKSLWKCLVQSAIVISASTCSSATLVADDAGQTGFARISKPKSLNDQHDYVTQVSATQGGCVAACAPPPSCPAPAKSCAPSCTTSCTSAGSTGCGSNTSGGGSDFWGRYDDPYDPSVGRFTGQGLYGALRAHGVGSSDQSDDCEYDDGFGRGRFGRRRHCRRCHRHPSDACLNYFRCKFGYFCPSGAGGAGLPWAGHYSRVYPVDPYYGDPRDGQAYAAQGFGIPISVPLAPVVGHTYDYSWGVPSSRLTPVSRPAY